MSKHRVLSLKPHLRLEWQGQHGLDETQEPDHSASLVDSIAPSTRIRFSVHTGITAVLDRSHVTDPQHHAFPISARTMIARRDNLKTTIATLSDQLARSI